MEEIQSWSKRGKCYIEKIDTNFFFEKENTNVNKKYCLGCPVINDCRIYAIIHEEYGIWGGTSETERKRIQRKVKGIFTTYYLSN